MYGDPILVVEDDMVDRELFSVLLQIHGYRVAHAWDAEQALAQIAKVRPRLILLDLRLPNASGLTLARQLKADAALRDIVVVGVTAYPEAYTEHEARAAGCDGYATKPLSTRTFAAGIAGYLAGPEASNGQRPGAGG